MNEADTCRKQVVPLLQTAGWDDEPHSIAEQRTITDGRIVPVGKGFVRKSPKRVDYLLRYTRDFPLAVVEAKPTYKSAADRRPVSDSLDSVEHIRHHRTPPHAARRERRLMTSLRRFADPGYPALFRDLSGLLEAARHSYARTVVSVDLAGSAPLRQPGSVHSNWR